MEDRKYKLISRKYKEFFWPTLAMTMANNMALFVDSVLVSSFLGVERMPAIQLCFPVVAFVNMVYWMLGLGGSLLASNTLADHDKDKANRYFSVSMFTVVCFGILVAVFGNLCMPWLSTVLCKDELLRGDVSEYCRVLTAGMPLLCFNMSLSYFSRADGFPKVGFWAVLLSNCVNLCMDTVLIKVCGMGLGGAALATVIGYVCGALYMLRYLLSKKREMRFVSPFKGGNYLADLVSISKKGIPTASSQLYIMLKTHFLNTIVTTYGGSVGLQVFSIFNNSLFLAYMIFIGTAQTLSPIVSVYAHEGEYDKARYVLKRSIIIALGGAILLALLFALCPQIILQLYRVRDPEAVQVCKEAIRLYVLSYPGLAFFYIMSYYFQAIKRQVLSAVMTALEGLVLPLGFAVVLAPHFGMPGVWGALICTETAVSIIIILYMRLSRLRNKDSADTYLLLPSKPDPNRFAFTVGMNIKEAVSLSQEAEEWVKSRLKPSAAIKTCLALEEMLTGIVMANGEDDSVADVVLRQENQEMIITMRDMGAGFNPTIEDKGLDLAFDNAAVLNKIASEIKYDRSIGMNATMIRLNCGAEE